MPRPRKPASPFRYFNSSPEVIRLVVMMYVRYPLSLRNVEDLLFERGIDLCHETVRFWWNRFGPLFAADIRQQRVSRMRGFKHWNWHLDEMCVKIGGEMHYLWRAVDQEGEVLESYVTKTRDKKAALAFIKKALKRHGCVEAITTDGLRSYGAALDELGNRGKQEIGRWANNRVENSHLPFRRRERAMLRFRQMKSLQKFSSVHASLHTRVEAVPANAVQLIPAEKFVEGRPEAVKFEIDADGTVQPENANLTLVAMPPKTTHYVEIPFKIAVPGTERMEVACQLSLFSAGFGGIETSLIAATRRSFVLPGSAAGRVRIAFAPFDPEQLAINILAGRQRQDSPPMVPVAICRMTAYGAGWSSETDYLDDMLAKPGRRAIKLVRAADGGEFAPLVTSAATVIVALPAGYRDASAQPSQPPSGSSNANPLPSGDDLRKKLCTALHNC